jgi:hypothetical protein
LNGQFRYTLMTDKLSAAMQIAEPVHPLAQEQNDPALMIGAYLNLACTLYCLGEGVLSQGCLGELVIKGAATLTALAKPLFAARTGL